jgi:hypothetical protein
LIGDDASASVSVARIDASELSILFGARDEERCSLRYSI